MLPPKGWVAPKSWFRPTERDKEQYRATQKKPSMKHGTPYDGCTQKDLDELLHATDYAWERFKRQKFKVVSLDCATQELEKALALPPKLYVQAARDRLRKAVSNPDWTPDLPVKAFYDLDDAFFGGLMRGLVKLRWKGTKEFMIPDMGPNYENTLGQTRPMPIKHVPALVIYLNAECLFLHPTPNRKRVEVWGTLMHEMIHGMLLMRLLSR